MRTAYGSERLAVAGRQGVAELIAAVASGWEATVALEGARELPGRLVNLGLSLHGLALVIMHVGRYREAEEAFGRAVELGLQVSTGEALRAGLAWQSMALDTTPDWAGAEAAGDGTLRALLGAAGRAAVPPGEGDVVADLLPGRGDDGVRALRRR